MWAGRMQLQCSPNQECCVQLKLPSDTNAARSTRLNVTKRSAAANKKAILTRKASPSTSRFLIAVQHSPRPCWKEQTYSYIVTVSNCHLLSNRTPRHIIPSPFMHIFHYIKCHTSSSSKWKIDNTTKTFGGRREGEGGN